MSPPWPLVAVGSVADLKNGLNYDSAAPGRGLKIIGVADFSHRRTIAYDDLKEIAGFDSIDPAYLLNDGDLLFVRSNGSKSLVGRVLLVENLTTRATHSAFTIRARVVDPEIDPAFLSYVFSTAEIRGQYRRLGAGTNISNLSQAHLSRVLVRKPPLSVQRAIIRVLQKWERSVLLTERALEANRQRRQWFLTRLLSPQRRGDDCANWPRTSLGEATLESTERNLGGDLSSELVRAVNRTLGMVPMRSRTIGEDIRRYKVVRSTWFAYNPMRLNIGSICVWDRAGDVLVSPDYVVFHCREDVLLPEYLNYLRETVQWQRFVRTAGNGSVRVRIYYDDLATFRFELPPIAEQRRIVALLRACDREIELLGRQLGAIREQMRGLMQRLLTGRLGIADATVLR